MSTKQPRNGLIELLRFLAGIAIAVYHFEWVYIGTPIHFCYYYIWVEFFFVLSGFFLAANASREDLHSDYETVHYVKKEFCKLYPLYFLAFLVSFAIGGGLKPTLMETLLSLWNSRWEILMCNMFSFGLTGVYFNGGGAPAYIPCLLCASLVTHYLIHNKREFFVSIAAPAFILIGYGRIISQYGNLSQWGAIDSGWLSIGIIRALAGISMGALAYLLLAEWLKAKKSRVVIAFAVSLFAIYSLTQPLGRYLGHGDLVLHVPAFALLIAAVHVLYSNAERPILAPKINQVFIFLGKLSYPIFLFHYSILILLKNQLPGRPYRVITLFLLAILLLATAITLVQMAISKYRRKLLEKCT